MRLFVSYTDKDHDRADYEEQIRTCVAEHFSKFAVPKEIVEVRKLPETPLMKVDFMLLTQDKPEDPVWTEPEETKSCLLPVEI